MRVPVILAAALGALALGAPAASAAPQFDLQPQHLPTNLAPGGTAQLKLTVGNSGDADTSGAVTVTATLPPGVTAVGTTHYAAFSCSGTTVVTCVSDPDALSLAAHPTPNGQEIGLAVEIAPEASGSHEITWTATGGGAPDRTVADAVDITAADAPFGLTKSGFSARVINADGSLDRRAGGHPYAAITEFHLATRKDADGNIRPSENDGYLRVDLPPGFIGDPQATSRCHPSGISNGGPGCPVAAQVGVAQLFLTSSGQFFFQGSTPAYNMLPSTDEPGAFGFNFTAPIHISAGVRTDGDNGISATIDGVSNAYGFIGSRLTLWGVPADPSHDRDRFDPVGFAFGTTTNAERRPFLTNPSDCSKPTLTTTLNLRSYERPEVTRTFASESPGVLGCDRLAFTPSLEVVPDSRVAGAPGGLAVEIASPQNATPDGLGTPPLRGARVTLPEGMAVSAASADGLEGCSDAQVALGSTAEPSCPAGSKIGTVELDTPILPDPMRGAIHLGTQTPSQLLRLFLVIRGPGVTLKLPGTVDPDPRTGRLTTVFEDNPQLPFTRLGLRFKGGARAALVNPPTCGTSSARAVLTSWGGQEAAAESPVTFDAGCGNAAAFTPSLAAGVINPLAGASSPFALDVTRPAGQRLMTGIDVALPEGLLARIGDVPRCAEAQAAAGTCDAASRVGRVTVAAGPGAQPLFLPQAGKAPTGAYLAGPYKGAPYSLSLVVPVQAGPLDLGTVVVRSALHVDPLTARVTVASDPLPTILKGIPLDVRRVRVDMDRPGFMVNPTDCAEQSVTGTVRSATDVTGMPGAAADVRSRFQVADCARLRLAPKLALALTGKGQTTDGRHPGVRATLTQRQGGQANLDRVRVKLPLSLALDVDNAQALCEFEDGSKVAPTCPPGSIVGHARAVTPILGVPLEGPVYFVKNVRITPSGRRARTLPKLVVPLRGDGVALTLTATSDVEDGHLVTTFSDVPDAPVSRFELALTGGRNGILAVSGADICAANQLATREVDGQNGRTADATVRMSTPACKLRVLSARVRGGKANVRVGGLSAGRVTVSGAGIRRTTRRVRGATVASISAPLTAARPARVRVTFTPRGVARGKVVSAPLR